MFTVDFSTTSPYCIPKQNIGEIQCCSFQNIPYTLKKIAISNWGIRDL